MATKLYFHDATTTLGGTLPGSTNLGGYTLQSSATGAATNRTMDTTIGVSQTSAALTTAAQQLNLNWFRRFLSPALAAQTLDLTTGGDIVFGAASQQSNTNAQVSISLGYLGVWRPSSGTEVQALVKSGTGLGGSTGIPGGTVETWGDTVGNSSAKAGASVSISDGDVLVVEFFNNTTQLASMSYTDTLYYDGTTEGSSASAASYISFPNDTVTWSTGAQPPAPPQQPLLMQLSRCG